MKSIMIAVSIVALSQATIFAQEIYTYKNEKLGLEVNFPFEPNINEGMAQMGMITITGIRFGATSSYSLTISTGNMAMNPMITVKMMGTSEITNEYKIKDKKIKHYIMPKNMAGQCTLGKIVEYKGVALHLSVSAMAADCPGDGSALPFFNSLTIKGVQMISADTDPNLYTTFEIPETDLSQSSVITTANVNPGKVAFQRLSNIDNNIPEGTIINENTFAVIIGNESYANEIPVKYARNDAAAFRDYMLKTMGIPEEQVHFLTDATYGTLLGEIDWIKSVARAYNGDAKIIFYYAGHGMPDESSKSAYILPTDGNASQTRTAIKVEELYAALTEFPTQQATVFLDACFSGAAREGMLASGRGVTIKPKTNALKGNLVVFTAVTDDQTAHPYEKEKHGMFSYFLMKKIQETEGNVTYQELAEYISKEVGRKSVILGEEQTPRVNVSLEVQDSWKSWKF